MTEETLEQGLLGLLPNLKSYLFRITANEQDAEDLTQETYIRASEKMKSYRGESSLKTWVFAIATNLARDHQRARQRWQEDIQDVCRLATKASPAKVAKMHNIVAESDVDAYEFREHIDYCFTCVAKTLKIEQQLVLILKEIYSFRVSDIMEILDLSEGTVKHALSDARAVMTDIFDRRCALVNQNGVCHQCSEINGFVNPKQAARQEELTLSHARSNGASNERLLELRTELIRGIDPLSAPGGRLHTYLLSLMPEHADTRAESE